jgi:predicted O-methyltransferase YrrM
LSESLRDDEFTLEVGVGASTVLFAAAGAWHTAISPDPDEHRLVREYCERSGVDHSRVTSIVGSSKEVLPTVLSRQRGLDLGFIDGDHCYPAPVIDWFYIARSLKPGGQLLLDGIVIPSAAEVFRHMEQADNWRLDKILDNRAAVFTMLAPEGGLTTDVPDRVPQASRREPRAWMSDRTHRRLPGRSRRPATTGPSDSQC